jgi:hypothetical protein
MKNKQGSIFLTILLLGYGKMITDVFPYRLFTGKGENIKYLYYRFQTISLYIKRKVLYIKRIPSTTQKHSKF